MSLIKSERVWLDNRREVQILKSTVHNITANTPLYTGCYVNEVACVWLVIYATVRVSDDVCV